MAATEKAAAPAKKESLSEGVGFATLKSTFPDASAQLVELMRATLRHAQEITASVDDAEAATERAQSAMTIVDTLTTPAERGIVDAEIAKVTNWLNRAPPESLLERYMSRTTTERDRTTAPLVSSQPASQLSGIAPAVVGTTAGAPAIAGSAATQQSPALGGDAVAASRQHSEGDPVLTRQESAASGTSGTGPGLGERPLSATTAPLGMPVGGPLGFAGVASGPGRTAATASEEMAEEIETTVMWVQQLLESVHFVESESMLEPGASLLSIVQPGRRHQKDKALHQSVKSFHEKKEEEEDAEDDAPLFRGQALQAVQAQRLAQQ